VVDNGYKPIVIASEGFKPIENYALPEVEMRFVPSITRSNNVSVDEKFDEDVKKTYEALKEALKGI